MGEERTVIELSIGERQLLAEVLEQDFRDLKQEIGRTESFDFREQLKARRDAIEAVLHQLGVDLS
jgi:hypothetical protein